jgi:hypothetical protein|tara:strand:- start:44 stop:280 length:237 start_codon:yes stop_codon:yes gene_type:complete
MTDKQEYLNSLSKEEKKRYYKIAMIVAERKKNNARLLKKSIEFKTTIKGYGVRAGPKRNLRIILDDVKDYLSNKNYYK